jgi:hypothetical protein
MGIDVRPEPCLAQPSLVVDEEAVAGASGRHHDAGHRTTIAELWHFTKRLWQGRLFVLYAGAFSGAPTGLHVKQGGRQGVGSGRGTGPIWRQRFGPSGIDPQTVRRQSRAKK